MARIVVSQFVSLDGVFEDPGGSEGWDRGGDVLVNGSAQVIEVLRANDLVDEYRLMVFPTVLGAGKRTFARGADASALRLMDAKPAGETLILLYEPKDEQ